MCLRGPLVEPPARHPGTLDSLSQTPTQSLPSVSLPRLVRSIRSGRKYPYRSPLSGAERPRDSRSRAPCRAEEAGPAARTGRHLSGFARHGDGVDEPGAHAVRGGLAPLSHRSGFDRCPWSGCRDRGRVDLVSRVRGADRQRDRIPLSPVLGFGAGLAREDQRHQRRAQGCDVGPREPPCLGCGGQSASRIRHRRCLALLSAFEPYRRSGDHPSLGARQRDPDPARGIRCPGRSAGSASSRRHPYLPGTADVGSVARHGCRTATVAPCRAGGRSSPQSGAGRARTRRRMAALSHLRHDRDHIPDRDRGACAGTRPRRWQRGSAASGCGDRSA